MDTELIKSLLDGSEAKAINMDKVNKYPYYKRHFADDLLATVDEVLTSRAPVIIKGNLNTSYLRWQQAQMYIRDHPERFHEDTLAKLLLVTVQKKPNVGLKISPNFFQARGDKSVDWRTPLTDYLNSAKPGDQPFERIGVNITDHDKAWFHETIKPVNDMFCYSLAFDRITVIRI